MKFSYHGCTVAQLHKELGALIAKGHGRKRVSVNKATFTHPLESDGVTHFHVHDVRLFTMNLCDDDGGTKVDSKGAECYRTDVVLSGIEYDDKRHWGGPLND